MSDINGSTLIFGGAGEIAQALAWSLHIEGKLVRPCIKNQAQVGKLTRNIFQLWQQGGELIADMTEANEVAKVLHMAYDDVRFIVYAVGHCPPMGVGPATSEPAHLADYYSMHREMQMHAIGLHNMLTQLTTNSLLLNVQIVVIGSAITEPLRAEKLPLWVQSAPYTVANFAKDALILEWRRDPAFQELGHRLDYLKFGGVDTEFYARAEAELIPRNGLLSLDDVCRQILTVIGTGDPEQTKIVTT